MSYGMIATWRMAYQAVLNNIGTLANESDAGQTLEAVISEVENFPNYISVGYGGLPNQDGKVQLDGAFMDGSTFEIGAVAGMENIKNPISVAKKLSSERFNSFLVGKGAQSYASLNGFKIETLLTEGSNARYQERINHVKTGEITPYDGHDTIGAVVLDPKGHMVAGTSSSGLFMKKDGRIGDSALPGSGFYVDSDSGGATATGLGEDLMKGILSYEIVRKMEAGLLPMEAAQQTLTDFERKLLKKAGKVGAMSLICMNKNGEWGVATNVDFTFVVATEKQKPTIYIAKQNEAGQTEVTEPSQQWVDDFLLQQKNRLE